MRHLDLFSGIGGFALAASRVWGKDYQNIGFCDNDPFAQAVLKKHWPSAEIHSDIRELIANTKRQRQLQKKGARQVGQWNCDLLTGGFPCQPFSLAGRRGGTGDDRYLWPAMLECISLYRPRWVIAENVVGLASWGDGMVLERVCTDLEKKGYEVQPFFIPACALGAPHRRQRIWIVAYAQHKPARHAERGGHDKRAPARATGSNTHAPDPARGQGNKRASGELVKTQQRQKGGNTPACTCNKHSSDTNPRGLRRHQRACPQKVATPRGGAPWEQHWLEVATRLCRVDDGVPRRMDRSKRLKGLGNAIVPQVAEQIMRAMQQTNG